MSAQQEFGARTTEHGQKPADALLAMKREAQDVIRWVDARVTVVENGKSGHRQPDTDFDTTLVRMIRPDAGTARIAFDAAVLELLARALNTGDGQVRAHVVTHQVRATGANSALRTRYTGVITDVIVGNGKDILFFDGTAVALADVTEIGLIA